MKTRHLAALISACCAVPALAQTSITIYGIADAGIQASRFGSGTQYNLASGMTDGSRLGFKGTEDLGGGFKALFTLESRIELDTGDNRNGFLGKHPSFALLRGAPLPTASSLALATALSQSNAAVNSNGALFDRTAMVGLVTPAGAVLLGRQYTPAYEIGAIADTFETGTVGGWGGITTGTGALYTPGVAIRSSSAIQYRLQFPNGLGAAFMYSPEDRGSGSLGVSNRFVGGNLRYQANGYDIGIGYNREDDAFGNRSLRTGVVGGSYTMGKMKFFAGYMSMRNDNPSLGFALTPTLTAALGTAGAALVPTVVTAINSNARLDAESYSLGMHYTIGAGRLMGAIGHTKNALFPASDVTLISLGYDHNLSKRTDVYLFFAHANNQANAQYALGGAGYSGGFTTTGGQDARAVQLGIRHRF
ncbi:MAG TPA: porin [Noviherbaspirillum sp.]|nr:porin [Noviherbaspirillum sp.]